ncbi:GDYXXLXY domain-containing protein [Paenibacillus sp. HWE-109]|uniref:GDYXXLXY domain-containing protein n=1 Tax=Paenibacillus sp. HWE-109 TaxID=1306526 RepID=UPI001EDD63BF|nr:GDYXXLXY domain-containing protein [Paenibacillus sp. HWE-109]UKS30789.1 GDYXXLXY domain-containing protein [Paenibacillus sp. HWE-109]
MKSKFVTIQLGYVLGASALLTAIVYFFATNWEKLNRWEKFVPVFVLILGFYGLSLWLSHKPGRHFLSRLSLFASCVSFGVGVGLIGQTYNSHADSYSLFAVWFIPAILFSFLTRWQPFYILSYVLGHIAYGLYFFPKWGSGAEDEMIQIAILLGLVVINGMLYVLTEREAVHSPFLKWVSFQAAMALLLFLSISHIFEENGIVMNVPLIAALVLAVGYAHRTRNKTYLLFAGLWVSATVTVKYIEVVIDHYNELFFVVSLLFLIAFIAANVKFMSYIRAWNPAPKQDETETLTDEAGKAHNDFTKWIVRVLTVTVIIIGSLLGSLTIIGIVTVVLGFEHPEKVLMGYGLLSVIAMIAASKLNSLARYTILISGLLLGAGTSVVMENETMMLVFLAVTILAFVLMRGLLHRVFFFLAAISITACLLVRWIDSEIIVLTVLAGVLAVLFAGSSVLKNDTLKLPILYSSYPSFLMILFSLTFITEKAWYFISNILFFLIVVTALVISKQKLIKWMYAWSMGFWIAYLVYKYYDLAWKLLHKSVTFAIIGIVLLTFTVWYEHRHRQEAIESKETNAIFKMNRWIIALLVLLQVLAMSLQIGKSEWLLAHGQLIKLKLEPLDPRSLIQGDYVRLRYTISNLEIFQTMEPDTFSNKKLAVVLAPNKATGVYDFKRVYREDEILAPDEVKLNGTLTGYDNVAYGIETYFIPEGTGSIYERDAKFAEVKVSAGGDAILVRLLLAPSIVQ